VTFPFPGGTEPIVYGLHDGVEMFHWHQDTLELPRLPSAATPPPGAPPPPTGSVLISSSKLCRNQAFRFKTRLFGFQYHFEFTESDIEMLLHSDAQALAATPDALARIRELTPRFYPHHAQMGNRILQNFVQFLKAY
jgi:GMP synthase-like glutamine amidotransferase